MHPQQVVKMQKYHHGQCTEEVRVRRVGRRQSKDEEDECERERARMRVGLRLLEVFTGFLKAPSNIYANHETICGDIVLF